MGSLEEHLNEASLYYALSCPICSHPNNKALKYTNRLVYLYRLRINDIFYSLLVCRQSDTFFLNICHAFSQRTTKIDIQWMYDYVVYIKLGVEPVLLMKNIIYALGLSPSNICVVLHDTAPSIICDRQANSRPKQVALRL